MSNHLIVTQRPWNYGLAKRLNERFPDIWFADTSDINPHAGWAVHNPEYVFFPHYSQKIPAEIYENYPCVIFHMTDLPFGRGGSPLQNLIARGHTQTKITAIKCVGEMDAGPVYCQRDLSLDGTAEEIFIRADNIMEDMIVEIATTRPTPTPQIGEPTTFKRRTPAQSNLKGHQALDSIYNQIRMVDADGYPKAFIEHDGFRYEFTRASRKTGHIIADVRITQADDGWDGLGLGGA